MYRERAESQPGSRSTCCDNRTPRPHMITSWVRELPTDRPWSSSQPACRKFPQPQLQAAAVSSREPPNCSRCGCRSHDLRIESSPRLEIVR
jgi:hypothetical protein